MLTVAKHISAVLKAITGTVHFMVFMLIAGGPLSQSDICQILRLPPRSINPRLSALLKAGLIQSDGSSNPVFSVTQKVTVDEDFVSVNVSGWIIKFGRDLEGV
jgi:hypothetical protein